MTRDNAVSESGKEILVADRVEHKVVPVRLINWNLPVLLPCCCPEFYHLLVVGVPGFSLYLVRIVQCFFLGGVTTAAFLTDTLDPARCRRE